MANRRHNGNGYKTKIEMVNMAKLEEIIEKGKTTEQFFYVLSTKTYVKMTKNDTGVLLSFFSPENSRNLEGILFRDHYFNM